MEIICKKVLELSPSTVNGAAEYRLGRETRSKKTICRIAKLWDRILHMEQEGMLECCWKWQKGNLKQKSWEASLREVKVKVTL
jgi:hypothetical protein